MTHLFDYFWFALLAIVGVIVIGGGLTALAVLPPAAWLAMVLIAAGFALLVWLSN
jgi:hypothetical protein